MLTLKYFSYNIAFSTLFFGLMITQQASAHHHHKESPPPSITIPKEQHSNPQQSPDDISPFARQAAENARQQQANIQQQDLKEKDGPADLLPGHYTKRSQKMNGTDGWVNSKRQRGKYDLGINMPVPQTADPTQNKTRGVFRRAMPVYEPNY